MANILWSPKLTKLSKRMLANHVDADLLSGFWLIVMKLSSQSADTKNKNKRKIILLNSFQREKNRGLFVEVLLGLFFEKLSYRFIVYKVNHNLYIKSLWIDIRSIFKGIV